MAIDVRNDAPIEEYTNNFKICSAHYPDGKDPMTDFSVPSADDPNIFDPSVDPNRPVRIDFEEVIEARKRILGGIIRTDCRKSVISKMCNMNLYLKMELQQETGSFKERGARNILLQLDEEKRKNGVITASDGNFAQALAYHGWGLATPVTAVMPKNASAMKIKNCRNHGATVLLKGDDLDEARLYALKLAKLNHMFYISAYDHPDVIAGEGTIGLEIIQQVPNVDAILIPVGGGSLLAGVATAVKAIRPEVQIFGVESECCPAFVESVKARRPVYTKPMPSIAEGLSIPVVGYNTLYTSLGLVDKMVQVGEEFIHKAMVHLLEKEKIVAEGAGATSLAAALAGIPPELERKTVVAILSGGNIDAVALTHVIERGLASQGRLCTFTVVLSDRPGGLAGFCKLLQFLGTSVIDITCQRAFLVSSVYSCGVKFVVETRNREHEEHLKSILKHEYPSLKWGSGEGRLIILIRWKKDPYTNSKIKSTRLHSEGKTMESHALAFFSNSYEIDCNRPNLDLSSGIPNLPLPGVQGNRTMNRNKIAPSNFSSPSLDCGYPPLNQFLLTASFWDELEQKLRQQQQHQQSQCPPAMSKPSGSYQANLTGFRSPVQHSSPTDENHSFVTNSSSSSCEVYATFQCLDESSSPKPSKIPKSIATHESSAERFVCPVCKIEVSTEYVQSHLQFEMEQLRKQQKSFSVSSRLLEPPNNLSQSSPQRNFHRSQMYQPYRLLEGIDPAESETRYETFRSLKQRRQERQKLLQSYQNSRIQHKESSFKELGSHGAVNTPETVLSISSTRT
ncbi:unnamed protein product [Calicophoron daubneyi]|uniref:L-serine deaminase n=1 Tax=Calicophoron daubneyi TaxID=300641 RepID=A0AAV2T5K8_CALDB